MHGKPGGTSLGQVLTLTRAYAALFGLVFAAYLVFLTVVLRHRSAVYTVEFATTVMPAIEVFCLFALGRTAWQFRRGMMAIPSLVVVLVCPVLLMGVYLSQGFSGYLSGDYISVVALENIAQSQFVRRPALTVLIVVCCVLWALLLVLAVKDRTTPVVPLKRRSKVAAVVIALLFVGMFDSRSPADSAVQLKPDMVPVTSLLRKVRTLYDRQIEVALLYRQSRMLGRRMASHRVAIDAPFPLMRTTAYSAPLPFAKTELATDRPNVIIIFTEGMSARWMANYHSKYPDVTPNLDRFAAKTMIVDNYYNHTAPTFRGVKGQLSSGYPRIDGFEPGGWTEEGVDNSAKLLRLNYLTVTDVFNDLGYSTAFLSAQPEGDNFNNMLRSLGFDTVYSFLTLPDLLDGAPLRPSTGTDSATDRDLFAAATGFLQREAADQDRPPFFMALYNIGTHAFLDADEQGVHYGDGSNPALNRMHNYDAQIGPFLDHFLQSPLARDTILIFTTDHATYNEPPVVTALTGPGYKPMFIDQVPLLVYNQGLDLPHHFDAGFRTSVDLAPSLLHMMGIQNVTNAFMGFSLFENAPDYHTGLAAMGEDFYRITPDGVDKDANVQHADKDYHNYVDYVRLYWMLELQNLIFPPRLGRAVENRAP